MITCFVSWIEKTGTKLEPYIINNAKKTMIQKIEKSLNTKTKGDKSYILPS